MKRIFYGWRSGGGKQLYVYDTGSGWGVTENPENATLFNSVDSCIFHWLSKFAWPEDYVSSLARNQLQFFDKKSKQQLLFIDDGKYLQRYRNQDRSIKLTQGKPNPKTRIRMGQNL